jgi:hypothetical protein
MGYQDRLGDNMFDPKSDRDDPDNDDSWMLEYLETY